MRFLINFHAADSSARFSSIYITYWHTKYTKLIKKQSSGINRFETIKSTAGNFEDTQYITEKKTQLRVLMQISEREHTLHLKILIALPCKILPFITDSVCFNTTIGPHLCPREYLSGWFISLVYIMKLMKNACLLSIASEALNKFSQ